MMDERINAVVQGGMHKWLEDKLLDLLSRDYTREEITVRCYPIGRVEVHARGECWAWAPLFLENR